jgi:NADH dehydrogenase
LTEALQQRGHQVVAIARRPQPAGWPADSRWIEADLLSPERYEQALAGADAVFHLAAVTGKARPEAYVRGNLEATQAVLDAATRAGVKRFVFVSSIAVTFPDRRFYPYAASKIAAEEAVRGSKLAWTIVRPTMILGQGSPIQASLARLARLPVIPMFGSGKIRVQPVDVQEVVAALVRLTQEPASAATVLELGGAEVISMLDLLRKLRAGSGLASMARFIHLPLSLLRFTLAALEKPLLPLLPFTAGQLASFANDSVASNPARAEARPAVTPASASEPR